MLECGIPVSVSSYQISNNQYKGERSTTQDGIQKVLKTAGSRILSTPRRRRSRSDPPSPPFPDGLCGGTLVSIDPSDLNFSRHFMLPPRPVEVWLPPTYHDDDDSSRHPVLYVHDGRNAAIDSRSWTGSSWRLPGALTRLHERRLLKNGNVLPILVLVHSASDDGDDGDDDDDDNSNNHDLFGGAVKRRHLEYGDLLNPFAVAHADFVAKTLKPHVDESFRTLAGPEHTYAMGSSLGGQAALHLLVRFPETFGGAACLSPCFQPATIARILADDAGAVLADGLSKFETTLYVDNGGDVDDVRVPLLDVADHVTDVRWWNPGYWWLDTQLQPSIDLLRTCLAARGCDDRHVTWRRFPGARHNERSWAWRVHEPLLCLFGRRD